MNSAEQASHVQLAINNQVLSVKDIQDSFEATRLGCATNYNPRIRPGNSIYGGTQGTTICSFIREKKHKLPPIKGHGTAFPTETKKISKACIECPVFAQTLAYLVQRIS